MINPLAPQAGKQAVAAQLKCDVMIYGGESCAPLPLGN